MSSVITFSWPAGRPAQMPPIRPATGPDMSSETGRGARPGADGAAVRLHQLDECRKPASAIASAKRRT